MPHHGSRRATAFRTHSTYPQPATSSELGIRVTVDSHHPSLATLGIPEWVVTEFEIGMSADLKHLTRRLVFPVRNAGGILVGYAGRWIEDPRPKSRPEYRFVGPVETEVYNLHAVIALGFSSLPVIVVSDPLDLLHLRVHYESVVSVFGDQTNHVQLQRLCWHFPNRQFLVLCDETDAERSIRRMLVERLCPFNAVKAVEFLTPGRTVRSLTLAEMREEL